MKALYITLLLTLVSCGTAKYQFSNIVIQDNNKHMKVKDRELGTFIFYLDDPLNDQRDKEFFESIIACRINGEKSFLLRGNMTTKINLRPGNHQIECFKYYDMQDENYIWKNAKKIAGESPRILKIKKGETKKFSMFYTYPVIVRDNERVDFNKYTFVRPKSEKILYTYNNPPVVLPVGVTQIKRAQPTTKSRAPASTGAKKSNTSSNVATDCAQYVAAKKSCELLPFGSSICISGLNSQFSTTVVEVCSNF